MNRSDAIPPRLTPDAIRPERLSEAYFIGIGGIGMSGLARWFARRGVRVRGYDKTPGPMTDALAGEGIPVHFEPRPEGLPGPDALVVYTPAVPAEFPELAEARRRGLNLHKRAAVLGALTADRFTIAVAGTHGKTTVSAMIAHLLRHAGRPCTAFLGGVAVDLGSNFADGDDTCFVVEADEYDRSFLHLEPDVAVVTATDADHLDIYGNEEALQEAFADFVRQIKPQGQLVARWGLDVHEYFSGRSRSYDLAEEAADWTVKEWRMDESGSYFTGGRTRREWHLPWPGVHNIENALAALSVAEMLDIPEDVAAAGLASFHGIRRRFEYRVRRPDAVLIDDYAHHPREIARLMESVRGIYGRRPVTVVFQPHLFSRTRDLAEGFAEALSRADRVLLLPIYPAREEPMPGITSAWLAERVAARPERRPVEVVTPAALPGRIAELRPDILLTVGAGDIDRLVDPLAEVLNARSAPDPTAP